MSLTSEEQARFDDLAKTIASKLSIQLLGMGRPVTTEAEIQKVAVLVADEVWQGFDPVPRTGPPAA